MPTSGFLDRLTATGGIDRSITAIDTVSLFATSTRTSYEPSSGGIAVYGHACARQLATLAEFSHGDQPVLRI